MGKLFGMADPHISLTGEQLFPLGPVSFTNSMLMMFISMVVVFLFLVLTAGRAQLVPTGRLQAFGEWIVEALLGLVEGVAGRRLGRQIFPLIGTLFLFILIANWLAIFPGIGTIGLDHEDHGVHHFVPLFRPANADLNMTIAMALVAFATIQLMGIRAHGFGGYIKELATPVFLFPVHVISELSRILSLSARLFGNIFGGEVFLFVIFFLFPLLVPLIPIGLEIFFGFIQAVLFSVLTLVYISLMAAGHGGGHHEDEVYGHAGHKDAGPTVLNH